MDPENELQAAQDRVDELERDLAVAEAAMEELENENPESADEMAVNEAGVRMVDSEIDGLKADLADANEDYRIAFERWREAENLPGDEDDEGDDDDGWPLSPEEPS
jgi:chromosome segregation ATPase